VRGITWKWIRSRYLAEAQRVDTFGFQELTQHALGFGEAVGQVAKRLRVERVQPCPLRSALHDHVAEYPERRGLADREVGRRMNDQVVHESTVARLALASQA
jgi:hypothetical protein